MSDPTRRIAKYTSKLIPENVMQDIIAKKPAMVTEVSGHFIALADLWPRFQGVIGSEGAVVARRIGLYWSFCEKVYSCVRTLTGAQLTGQVAVHLATWKARNSEESVLIRLRNELFSIPAPFAPFFSLHLATTPDGVGYAITPGYDGAPVSGATAGVVDLVLDSDVEQTIALTKTLYDSMSPTITASEGAEISETYILHLT